MWKNDKRLWRRTHSTNWLRGDKNYHILEILTKEQFEANCYKVGGEDEC